MGNNIWHMVNIIKARDLPEGENVYLKKGFTGEWRTVRPYKREDGSRDWFAIFFGSKENLFYLIIIGLISIGLYFGILDLINSYSAVAENPCAYCSLPNIDLSNITLKGGRIK